MTLTTSLLAPVSLPVVLSLSGALSGAAGFDVAGAMLRLALGVTAVAALPLALGLWLQRRFSAEVRRWQAGLERAARLVFALIVLTTFWANRAVMLQHFGSLGAAALALNLGAVAAGLSLRLVGLSAGQALAAAVECGLQNAAIAIFVAVTVLGRTELAVPALIYAVIMNVTALALVGLARRNATA
jgi:BASS family bile acid:Na+ symporter